MKTEFIKPNLPEEAKEKCADPVQPPLRRLSEPETTTYWNIDRAALVKCETRRAAAVSAYEYPRRGAALASVIGLAAAAPRPTFTRGTE